MIDFLAGVVVGSFVSSLVAWLVARVASIPERPTTNGARLVIVAGPVSLKGERRKC